MLFDHVSQSSPLKGLLQSVRKGIAAEAASYGERGRGAGYRSLRMGSPAFVGEAFMPDALRSRVAELAPEGAPTERAEGHRG